MDFNRRRIRASGLLVLPIIIVLHHGDVRAQAFGRYVGTVKTEWLADGRKMQLLEDLVYVDTTGKTWTAPKNSKIDGASIPSSLWSIVGRPYEGTYRDATVLHDVECDRKKESWEDVHHMFYEAMRASGVADSRALYMYLAVRNFGPRWKRVPNPGGVDRGGGVIVEDIPMRQPSQEELESLRKAVEDDRTITSVDQVDKLSP